VDANDVGSDPGSRREQGTLELGRRKWRRLYIVSKDMEHEARMCLSSVFHSFECVPSRGIAGSFGNSMFKFEELTGCLF
jgi:hypothetical protein